MKNPKHIENPSLDRFLSSLIAMFWIGRLHSWIFRFHNHDSRTPYAKIISIYDRFTGENLCAKVITKQFCNPSGILVLDPDLLTSIRHRILLSIVKSTKAMKKSLLRLNGIALRVNSSSELVEGNFWIGSLQRMHIMKLMPVES